MSELKLGVYVEDRTSGLRGYVIQRLDMLSGAIQYCVQPKAEDATKYPEAYFIDYHLLREIPEIEPLPCIEPDHKQIDLGTGVRYIVNGYSGIATGRNTYLNGCVHYSVESKDLKEGKPQDPIWFAVQSLEFINVGISEKVKPQVEREKPTGCAPTRAQAPMSRSQTR